MGINPKQYNIESAGMNIGYGLETKRGNVLQKALEFNIDWPGKIVKLFPKNLHKAVARKYENLVKRARKCLKIKSYEAKCKR